MSAVYGAADCVFQSTPPRGWRRKPTSAFCEGEQFQSTPPRGWRLTVWISPNSSRLFQSTPPRGWRPRPFPLPRHLRKFQSTPPRGWRPDTVRQHLAGSDISIHSTTRVETQLWYCPESRPKISIHSTTRVETWKLVRVSRRFTDFNPLHHEGGDVSCTGFRTQDWKFQSTPPRGWRLHPAADSPADPVISIHSTTRVETAILHNNHYYSSTHFHKQIISHPLKSRPTIPAHSQIRSHCANFPVRISP